MISNTKIREQSHSGVWDMSVPPRSSLVGRSELGLGEAGGLTRLMGEGRPDGPIDALAVDFGVPFGAGEGLGLVEGGRRDMGICRCIYVRKGWTRSSAERKRNRLYVTDVESA